MTKVGFWLAISTVLSLALSQAQEAKPLPRHPGDIIKYQIHFDGPNADKIKTVNAGMNMRGPVSKDQSGFSGGFGTAHAFTASSPNTFDIEMTIPNNAATGDYFLYVRAQATEGDASYQDGQEFNTLPIHVENPKTFTPPGIIVKPLP